MRDSDRSKLDRCASAALLVLRAGHGWMGAFRPPAHAWQAGHADACVTYPDTRIHDTNRVFQMHTPAFDNPFVITGSVEVEKFHILIKQYDQRLLFLIIWLHSAIDVVE